jgi:Putative prokaryotic signal transducing protein
MSEPEYDIEKLVTLETFSSPWEAQLARACLEAEGVHAVIADEHFFRLYGALSSTLGGVRLQVRSEEAERAAELLRNRRPVLYLVNEEDGQPGALEDFEEPEALVIVGRFTTPWEAHLARTLLESEGIDACVLEERLPSVSLLTGQPVALNRVEVHPEDAERALEILAEVEELEDESALEP